MATQLALGIYEKALPYNITWRERLDLAKSAGFDFVEMSLDESDERLARLAWSPRERAELRDAIAETGVPITTMCLSGHRKFALGSADAVIRARAFDILRRAIDLAIGVNIRIIQLAGYYVYYEPHTLDSRARYRDGLAQGLAWASNAGVMLALENVDGNDVDSITRAMEFVCEFDSPWFQIYPDIGNLGEHGLDVRAELERGRGHIVGVHVKDTRPGEPRRVPFGQGVVPFVDAFQKLAALNFVGPVMLEMWNDDSPNAVRIIRESREWVLARMREGGLWRDA
ncbi:MAG: L-ribulose-5-phosphate 3-epimerase [Chloroflexota bacterium]